MFFRMILKSKHIFLPFCHNSRVWRTNGRTDGILIARPRLHSMQRGKNRHARKKRKTPGVRGVWECIELLQKETPNFITPQLWTLHLPDLNPVDNSMWEILQEKVYKTSVTNLELSMTPLTNVCRNDDMIQLRPLRSQSLFQFVQISDAYSVHLLLQ